MTNSMTAYARAQTQVGNQAFFWEIKSVNHRYLDIAMKLPDAFRCLEMDLRNKVREFCVRGKIECSLRWQEDGSTSKSVAVNQSFVDALIKAGESIAADHHIANDLTLKTLLTIPGVLREESLSVDSIDNVIADSFQEALLQLKQMRSKEGRILTHFLRERLGLMAEEVQKARQYTSQAAQDTKEKTFERLKTLSVEVEQGRVEQELALLIMRLDVSEELDRIEAHLEAVEKLLAGDEPSGRRLDFLMQELNREANTLTSKSATLPLTQCALEMKVLIEQMREQIQNIE